VFDGCTSQLASDVSMAAAALSSFKEAQDMLTANGCELDFKTIRSIVKRFSARARLCQEQGGLFEEDLEVAGCRVVISIDGGRIRVRKNKKGPKTKKNRSRYYTDWREPKLFIIYVVNDEGRMSKKFCPFIDATLNGPEEVFALLKFYLTKIDISKAGSVVFVADGAPWIWERASVLLASFPFASGQVHFVLDFYHAVEQLSKLMELKKITRGRPEKVLQEVPPNLAQGPR
jgi:hypothetical protein